MRSTRSADCAFNQAAPYPAYPIKCHMSTQRTQAPESADNAHNRAAAIDPLENSIGRIMTFPLRADCLARSFRLYGRDDYRRPQRSASTGLPIMNYTPLDGGDCRLSARRRLAPGRQGPRCRGKGLSSGSGVLRPWPNERLVGICQPCFVKGNKWQKRQNSVAIDSARQ